MQKGKSIFFSEKLHVSKTALLQDITATNGGVKPFIHKKLEDIKMDVAKNATSGEKLNIDISDNAT